MLREILATSESKAKYYKTFKGNKHFKLVQPELEESIQIMSYCLQVAQNNQQSVLMKEFNDKILSEAKIKAKLNQRDIKLLSKSFNLGLGINTRQRIER